MSDPDWPPEPPEGAKPNFSDPGAAEWRYQRYKYERYQTGKQEDTLPFETIDRDSCTSWRSRPQGAG